MTDAARRETLFRELRQALMLELEEQGEQTDEEVQARIDALIQERSGRESLSLRLRENLYTDLFNSVRKLDILQELVDDTEVTEIMINGWKNVFYEKQGRILRWDKSFASPERLEDVIQVLFIYRLLLFILTIIMPKTPCFIWLHNDKYLSKPLQNSHKTQFPIIIS